MGFVDRGRDQGRDELPGTGLHLDLEVKRCPDCRREVLPWQATCPDCGTATVPARQLRDETPHPPGLADTDAEDDEADPPEA